MIVKQSEELELENDKANAEWDNVVQTVIEEFKRQLLDD